MDLSNLLSSWSWPVGDLLVVSHQNQTRILTTPLGDSESSWQVRKPVLFQRNHALRKELRKEVLCCWQYGLPYKIAPEATTEMTWSVWKSSRWRVTWLLSPFAENTQWQRFPISSRESLIDTREDGHLLLNFNKKPIIGRWGWKWVS